MQAGHRLVKKHIQALQVAVHDLGRLPMQVGHALSDVLGQFELLPHRHLVIGEVQQVEQ
jgi:hypothetical protein